MTTEPMTKEKFESFMAALLEGWPSSSNVPSPEFNTRLLELIPDGQEVYALEVLVGHINQRDREIERLRAEVERLRPAVQWFLSDPDGRHYCDSLVGCVGSFHDHDCPLRIAYDALNPGPRS